MHFTDVLCGKMETTKPVPTEKAEAPRTISRFVYNGRCFWTVKDKYLLICSRWWGFAVLVLSLSRKHRDSPPSGDLEGCSGRLSVLGPSSNLAGSSRGSALRLSLLLGLDCIYNCFWLLASLLSTQLHTSYFLTTSAPRYLLIGISVSFKPCFFQLFSFYVAHIQTFRRRSCLENRFLFFIFCSSTEPYLIICSQSVWVLAPKTLVFYMLWRKESM